MRVKLLNLEEKIELISKNNESLIKEKESLEKNIKEKNEFYQNLMKKMKNSYDNLVKNLSKLSKNYHESTKKIMELSKYKLNKENEIKELNITNTVLEKENLTLKAENEGMRLSRWFVGSSRMSRLHGSSSRRIIANRLLSPPESTLTFLSDASPPNIKAPRMSRIFVRISPTAT